eukprot:NODE_1585_length_803_cov_144.997041_g1536_i0.p1 GENE.NODE_1585_length_803_cov_144.997041_g1536_i0~~NODE_1585_length_803_cov_144.997041_g1536_i0.p1  ORF type:complete len:243 (-),score=17.04 NODE_1585_length_803_cov_144.997041_g1536_i0:4-732(-)
MCWSLQVSAIAGVYGLCMSYFFWKRGYSDRDPWYGMFLLSFTCTQFLDAFFWYQKGEQPDIHCGPVNLYFSKFVVTPVLFGQCIVLSIYKSGALKWARWPYRILVVLAALVPVIFGSCTHVWHTMGLWHGPTLVYWGFQPPMWMMLCGITLWSVGALSFLRPWWVGTNILAVGGFNLVLLTIIDGTIRLVSKLCFYCLLLSLLWLTEPLWAPSVKPSEENKDQPKESAPLPPAYDPVATSVV